MFSVKTFEGQLRLMRRRPVLEREISRRAMMDWGVYVLSPSEEPLSSIIPRKEAERILSLVREDGFALALLGGAVVGVSPASSIRPHLGVSERLLSELDMITG